jgi:hypothetical protein
MFFNKNHKVFTKNFHNKIFIIGLLLLFNNAYSASYLFNNKSISDDFKNQEINYPTQISSKIQASNLPLHGSSTENEENYECECQNENDQEINNSNYKDSIQYKNCEKSAKLFAFNAQILNKTFSPLYLLFHSWKIFLS